MYPPVATNLQLNNSSVSAGCYISEVSDSPKSKITIYIFAKEDI